jgi:uncharacterized protein with PQ loop repeat
MNTNQISDLLSIISLIFYSIVYLPQFLLIYKSKSSEGVSILMLLLWTQADILSLIGTIVLYMPISIIAIGWYHSVIGCGMIIFALYYYKERYLAEPMVQASERYLAENNDFESESNIVVKKGNGWIHNKFLLQIISGLFMVLNLCICISLNLVIKESYYEIGTIIGWITMSLYLLGRVPQLVLNYTRKSTEGLSLLMYIFTMLGNACYIGVITVDPTLINSNMPWIITGVVTIFLDIVVLGQHFYYKK